MSRKKIYKFIEGLRTYEGTLQEISTFSNYSVFTLRNGFKTQNEYPKEKLKRTYRLEYIGERIPNGNKNAKI